MKEKLLYLLKNKYKSFEIDNLKYNELYDEMVQNTIIDTSVDTYYQYYFELIKYIDNYIISEIKKDNLIYQINLSDMKKYVIKKYFDLKPEKLDMNYINSKYPNIKDKQVKLDKYYTDLSDEITYELSDDYDYHSSLDHMYIKKLNKNLTNKNKNI